MNVWAPEQMYRLGFRHRPEYIKDREAMRGMTYDQEVRLDALDVRFGWALLSYGALYCRGRPLAVIAA